MLQLKDLQCGYKDGKTIISAPPTTMNAVIHKPTLIALLGNNGIGKSTLLRSICGIHPIISGDVLVNNKSIRLKSPAERAKIISFLPPYGNKIHFITVEQYVKFGAYPYSSLQISKNQIYEALEQVDLMAKKEHFLNQLSDGELQRASIARILIQDTPIMLFDEVTSHLDPVHQFKTLLLLSKLVLQKQKIVIFSTHITHEALKFAHKIWILTENEFMDKIPEQVIIDKDLENNDLIINPVNVHIIQSSHNISIRLIGDGIPYNYTRHALLRYGIEANSTNITPISVIIQQSQSNKTMWLIKKDNTIIQEIHSLEQLIDYLIQ
jgi:iron complex transport system ATP-binding protein